MADISTSGLNKPIYVGTHGNFSLATTETTLAAAPSGDKVLMMTIPVGTTIHGIRVFHENLGSGVTVQLAIRNAAGTETNLGSSITASNTTPNQQIIDGVYIDDAGPSQLIAILGGGTATGRLKTQLEIVATGY